MNKPSTLMHQRGNFRIVRQMVDETYENDDHFDVTYVVIVFVAILPALIVPAIVGHWILIGSVSLRHIGRLFSSSDTSETALGEVLKPIFISEPTYI